MPKLDDDGLLRCDGRLCYAEFLPYDNRFPVVLPRGSWLMKLIVKHYHELGKHITRTNHTASKFVHEILDHYRSRSNSRLGKRM